jgi:DNA-binding winged helix-turn-helix (wHTH) protein
MKKKRAGMLGGYGDKIVAQMGGGAMSEPRNTIGSMHFGPFELSTESSELRKHGQRLKLSGQAIDVLLMLASNAGRLVTREELQRKLWPGDSFGDFDHGLNAAVNRLRETLGDSATDPTYIETVPRRGYRFIARVDQIPNTADPTVPDNAVELRYQHAADIRADVKGQRRDADSSITHTPSEISSKAPLGSVGFTESHPSIGAVLFAEIRRHKGVLAMTLVGLAVLIAGLGMYFSRLNGRGMEWNQQGMAIRRVTQSGNAVNVAISPDGHYIVYALREGEKQSLNVRQVQHRLQFARHTVQLLLSLNLLLQLCVLRLRLLQHRDTDIRVFPQIQEITICRVCFDAIALE